MYDTDEDDYTPSARSESGAWLLLDAGVVVAIVAVGWMLLTASGRALLGNPVMTGIVAFLAIFAVLGFIAFRVFRFLTD